MAKHTWLSHENTDVLMRHCDHIGLIPEWQPVATVFLRQVYPAHPPLWYATGSSDASAEILIGRYEDREQAKAAVLRVMGLDGKEGN